MAGHTYTHTHRERHIHTVEKPKHRSFNPDN